LFSELRPNGVLRSSARELVERSTSFIGVARAYGPILRGVYHNLDRHAAIHRPVALLYPVEVHGPVEDVAGLDPFRVRKIRPRG
jgi:hypothetical protein